MEIKFNSSFDKSNDSEFNRFEKSQSFLDHFRLINVYSSLLIVFFGLIGNSIVVAVFSRKKNRSNPSHVFIFCSAIVDNLFLITHLFEVTTHLIPIIIIIKLLRI